MPRLRVSLAGDAIRDANDITADPVHSAWRPVRVLHRSSAQRSTHVDGLASYLRGIDASLGGRPKAVLVIRGTGRRSGHGQRRGTAHPLIRLPRLSRTYLSAQISGRCALTSSPECGRCWRRQGSISEWRPSGAGPWVFVPFMLIYPRADVPMMQLSLQHSLDPSSILRSAGRWRPCARRVFSSSGSGMSYHNLAAMFSGGGRRPRRPSMRGWAKREGPEFRAIERLTAWRSDQEAGNRTRAPSISSR